MSRNLRRQPVPQHAAGLVERRDDQLHNTAVLLSPAGQIKLLLQYRESDIALNLYPIDDTLGVARTKLGVLGLTSAPITWTVRWPSVIRWHAKERAGCGPIAAPRFECSLALTGVAFCQVKCLLFASGLTIVTGPAATECRRPDLLLSFARDRLEAQKPAGEQRFPTSTRT
jgi:hypothetical protein